jgi:hypothetical protein
MLVFLLVICLASRSVFPPSDRMRPLLFDNDPAVGEGEHAAACSMDSCRLSRC